MAERREKPYIHMTWISPLLIGENHCKWAAWYQTHFHYVQVPSTFDEVAHRIKHTALRDQVLGKLKGRDCSINVEQKVFIDRPRANLSGKIDLLAYKGDRGVIFELKSGKPWPTDKAQLMLYMWALKRAYKRFQHVLFDGRVVYPDSEIKVSAVEIDDVFCKVVEDFVVDLLDNEPERRFPSKHNCRFCKVAECDERYAAGDDDEEPSDFIPNFL
jgi:CRISPR/Cas system-associated exonuclease Cas4 (RecB family)